MRLLNKLSKCKLLSHYLQNDSSSSFVVAKKINNNNPKICFCWQMCLAKWLKGGTLLWDQYQHEKTKLSLAWLFTMIYFLNLNICWSRNLTTVFYLLWPVSLCPCHPWLLQWFLGDPGAKKKQPQKKNEKPFGNTFACAEWITKSCTWILAPL